MTVWLIPSLLRVRSSSPKPPSSSASSSSASSKLSYTSTIGYGHESFRTFESRVMSLTSLIPQLSAFPASTVRVTRMVGGSNYRIIGITTGDEKRKVKKRIKGKKKKIKGKDQTVGQNTTKYILRVPREERNNNTHLEREVAVLRFLGATTFIPVPKVIAFDLDGTDNCPIELPYVLETCVADVCLEKVFGHMKFEEKKQFIHSLVDLYVKMDKVRFAYAGVLGPSSKRAGSDTIEVTAFDFEPEPSQTNCHSPYPQQTTRDMLLSQFESWKFIAEQKHQSPRGPGLVSRYMDKFIAVTLQMEKRGWLGDNKNVLFHPHLSPRHIFVSHVTTNSKKGWEISGVIDWEAALSVPRVMSNRVPSWLWRWGPGYDCNSEGGDDDNNTPKDKECEELKHQFEMDISGHLPKFLGYAYQPKYQLVRKLCWFAIWGLKWDEDIKRADKFLKEWDKLSSTADSFTLRRSLTKAKSNFF